MKKEKLKTVVIIILIVVLLGSVINYTYNVTEKKAYSRGYNDATFLINEKILNGLKQNGYVPFVYVIDNQTQIINLAPVQS